MARPRKNANGSNGANGAASTSADEAAERARQALDEAERERVFDMATTTLTGDLRDFILDRLRHEQNKQPWHMRSEADQRFTVNDVETAVRYAVARAVEIIAAKGQNAIKATLTQVTFKEGIKASIELSSSEPMRHVLADATGGKIVIFVADPEQFDGERAPAEVIPDQGDLVNVLAVHSDELADRHDNPLN